MRGSPVPLLTRQARCAASSSGYRSRCRRRQGPVHAAQVSLECAGSWSVRVRGVQVTVGWIVVAQQPGSAAGDPSLIRSLGTFDAVVIGLGFDDRRRDLRRARPGRAAAAGSGLLVGLAVAAVVAYCNATSSARLAARYPQSGGTYVYGRERLGDFWGYLAGWGFVVGKTASLRGDGADRRLYVWPAQAHAVAVAAVVALTAVNYVGVQKAAWLTRAIVACRAGRAGRGGHRLPDQRHGRGPARLDIGGGCHRGRRPAGGWAAVLRVRRLRPHRHPG